MSVKSQALRALVLERLAVAADEIFALFEQTIAQFEEEVLRSKLMQQPRVLLYKEDVQMTDVGLDIRSPQVTKKIKQEMHPPINLQGPISAEENRQNLTEKQSDPEEPGCSSDLILNNNRQLYSCSNLDNSDHWDETTTQSNGGEHSASLLKDSAENNVNCDNSFSSNTVMSKDAENREIFFKCSHCYRYFKTTKALEKHLQLHVKKNLYNCQICNKSYTDRSNYNKHLRIHNEHKLFSCSICKRGFAQRLHFDEHMRIHTGEKPLSCSDCGRRFRHKNALIRHVFSQHSVEKPYPCPICPKGFVEKKYFVAHMRKHTGEKPFMCPVCNKTFDSQSYVNKHVLTHKVNGGITSEGLETSFHGYLNVK
ncbi:uncharacterized protein [Eucyclogobius newberryi]|uniref:uncharacterized protein isoform X3 n=1 Tax=Eucyclogobius newberryi TaxID=166745 RepID=UPI003B5B85CE